MGKSITHGKVAKPAYRGRGAGPPSERRPTCSTGDRKPAGGKGEGGGRERREGAGDTRHGNKGVRAGAQRGDSPALRRGSRRRRCTRRPMAGPGRWWPAWRGEVANAARQRWVRPLRVSRPVGDEMTQSGACAVRKTTVYDSEGPARVSVREIAGRECGRVKSLAPPQQLRSRGARIYANS